MYDMILQGAVSLGVDGMERLISDLKAAVLGALGSGGAEPARCPRCGCAAVARRGRTSSGAQRWACRGCGRTFTAATGRVLSLSRLGAATWSSYVEGMVAGESLRALASRCGVCLKTSWFMRMRVLEVMRSQLQPMRHGEGVSAQADELYLNESLSGNRDRARVAMPREPHRNGHGVRAHGISSLKVAVVTVVNDLGDCTAEAVGRGRPTADEVRSGIAPADVSGSSVSTDALAAYAAPLAEAGAAAHNRYGSGEAGEDELGMVNALHERLRGFLWRFRGVATRRLQRYLWWFRWEEQARRSDATREGMLRAHVANGRYESRRRDLEDEPQPFWGYWDARRPSISTVV